MRKKKGDTFYTLDAQGNPTNKELHEELLAEVDDSEFRKKSYELAKASGVSENALRLLK